MQIKVTHYAAAAIAALVVIGASVAYADSTPPPGRPWLSNPGIGSVAETDTYYAHIGAPATLAGWQTQYGFPSDETKVVYHQDTLIGLAREVHCRRDEANAFTACYSNYYGLAPGGPKDIALARAISGTNLLHSTALVYSDSVAFGNANQIAFYTYDASGNLATAVPFDSQGDKAVPQVCMACHGGYYDDSTHDVYESRMIPFDPSAVSFNSHAGYSLADQQEALRVMNGHVMSSTLTSHAQALIDGMYPQTGGVQQSGNTAQDGYVPPLWDTNVTDRALYTDVVKPSCMGCHLAQTGSRSFQDPSNFDSARYALYHDFSMPHAEIPYKRFWASIQAAQAARSYAWTETGVYTVTRTDDPTPDGCAIDDCSLREAVIAANADTGSYNPVIAFVDLSGVYTLAQVGDDDTAALGDLDITPLDNDRTILILGNGGRETVIDGGGIDRVFDVQAGARVRMQHVTIQHGQTNADGAGVHNLGELTLADSNVLSNTSAFGLGAGIYNSGRLIANRSRISGNQVLDASGSAIANAGGGQAELTNSTLDGKANISAGLTVYNVDVSSAMTLTHVTIYNSATVSDSELIIDAGSVYMANSVIADSAPIDSAVPLCRGTITSGGYNVFVRACSTTGVTSTDQIISIPGLGTLSNAGGHSDVYVLSSSSPLIDAIPQADCVVSETDQRQIVRPQDGNRDETYSCDIGAYESQGTSDSAPITLTVDLSHGGLSTLGQTSDFTATLNYHDLNGFTYAWDFGDGISDSSTSTVISHTYANAGSYTAWVTASNGITEASASTFVTITNLPPVSHAGSDQLVATGAVTVLDGGASHDPDGHTPLNFGWVQTGGPAVVLSTPVNVTTTFSAPTGPAILTFTLRVTDSYGLVTVLPDTVNVVVNPSESVTHTFALTVTRSGSGSGTVTSTPAGINCGIDCAEIYIAGAQVTLTAVPDIGSTFISWDGDAGCSGTTPCAVTMSAAHTVNAIFARANPRYQIFVPMTRR